MSLFLAIKLPASLKTSAALVALSFSLAACVSAPPVEENSDWAKLRNQIQELNSWQFRGRVNVRYDGESHTPRIDWLQQSNEYHIQLWGTFNVGRTTVVGRPGFVTLEQGNEVRTANSPEQLILQSLGYELPVSLLEFWIKGIPATGSEADLTFNELNLLTRIEQEGWSITFPDPRQYGTISLPREVILTRPQNDIRLRFIGLNWSLEKS